MMRDHPIIIRLIPGPLPPALLPRVTGGGATLCFEGVVRPDEGGRPLRALQYEAYPPMTQNELRRLAEECVETLGLLRLVCEHSVGEVAASECSFRLTVVSAHRKAAIEAIDRFIDRMKRDVPLWKVPLFEGEA